ncbi:hypothetical protein ISG33_16090 [Glaciecola sp. MH2013]|uniref:hypothetical protein n=1 Tax=Glaciecola sp. MH2013 TaxID=2785524 RepID=UPI00189F8FC4|nr:hypothetical protein [Glaciecola sp. MH2013]MBF7074923.1 hypothetical protein [Glaciecola sp. MH2013]
MLSVIRSLSSLLSYNRHINKSRKQTCHQRSSTPEQSNEDQWQDTGEVYYLENTLKLSYQSKHGKVTFEELNFSSLSEVLKDIRKNEHDYLKQSAIAGQKIAFNISLCAVTWQTKGESTRIKAVADAALLRSTDIDFTHSQAVFKQDFMLEHDDVLSASGPRKKGVSTYYNVSVPQFLVEIKKANLAIAPENKRRINVKHDNFDSMFSENETLQLQRVLSSSNTKEGNTEEDSADLRLRNKQSQKTHT